MIFGAGKKAQLSNLAMVANCYVRITLASAWPVTENGEIINFINEGGTDDCHQNAAGAVWPSSGLSARINGVNNETWTQANLPAGQNCGFRLSAAPAAIQAFTLFSDENDVNTIAVDVSMVEIYESDNSTPIHRFDLDAATGATVSDSVGSGVLSLTGFVFGATLDVTETSLAFGDNGNYTSTGLGTRTSWTLEDSQSNSIAISGTDTGFSIPALGDGVNRVLTGTVTLTVGDGTNTASATFTLTPPTGYSSINLESGFDTSSNSFLDGYSGTPAVPDEFLFVTTEATLYPNGNWSLPEAGTTTFYGIDASDGVMESAELAWNEAVTFSPSLNAIATVTTQIQKVNSITTELTAISAFQTSLQKSINYNASLSADADIRASNFKEVNYTPVLSAIAELEINTSSLSLPDIQIDLIEILDSIN